MMRTLSFAIAALAVSLPGQSRATVELSTAEACGVHANRQIDAVRAGVVADRPITLTALDGRMTAAGSVARRDVFRTPAGDVQGAAFEWSAHAADGDSAGTLGGDPFSAGAQHYAVVFRADRSIQGRLVLVFEGAARGNASANAGVSTGGVGKRFAADGTLQRDSIDGLSIGSRGLHVDVYVNGAAAGANGAGAGYGAGLQVMFVADGGGGGGCQVLPGQSSCPEGGTLRGAVTAGRDGGVLALGLSGALPNAIGLTIVSPTGRTFPIPSTNGCIFFTLPIAHEAFMTDANGDARTAVRFPMRIGSFFVQQGTVLVTPRGFRIATSNTLEVQCR